MLSNQIQHFLLWVDQQLIMSKITSFLLILTLLALTTTEVYQINLDLPATQRYSQISAIKKHSIQNFISYLKKNVQKYKLAFETASRLHALAPRMMRNRVGHQFYDQCKSIATGAGLLISDIIIFNYMYELGAATDFCTAITYATNNIRLLGRNLDYGYQEYLANNSVHLQYLRKGELVLETLGHAGFIGTHTALKRATKENPLQYAITLNERVEGGLHKTLAKIMSSQCQTCPYAMMKTLRQCQGSIQDVVKCLNNMNTCAAVYYTIISKKGSSYVIEKSRGVGVHRIRESQSIGDVNFIVQTNHDFEVNDPDTRSTIAREKLMSGITGLTNANTNIWQILTEKPNFNKLTLMTGLIDIQNGEITYQVWE